MYTLLKILATIMVGLLVSIGLVAIVIMLFKEAIAVIKYKPEKPTITITISHKDSQQDTTSSSKAP